MALRVALSWTALLWERLWRELWPAAALAALFFALAASGVLPLLGGWAHSALLALFAVGVTLLLVRGGRRVATPQSGDARRRLERVLMVLRAADAIGQSAESEPVALTLPQRVFQHPVAQAIVDFRRQLAWDPLANREAVRDGLDALASTPEQFGSDTAVFLSLNAAVRRLDLDNRGREPSDETVAALLQQLWETALYLEDGGASLALERLRAAERALQEALDRDADMAELERLMDELQQAMSEC
eukprot:g16153.t1